MSDVNTGAPAPAADTSAAAPVDGAAEVVDDGSDLGIADSGAPTDATAIDAAAKAGQITKQQAVQMKKTLKLKVDGQEENFEFDPNDEASLVRELQKARAFDKRNKEHSGFKSQVDQFLKMLQEAPESALEKMGIDVDKLAEARLSKRVEEMKKTPQQIKEEKLQAELEQLRKEKKDADEAKQKAQQESMRNKAAAEIETDISEALENAKSFLPKKSPWVLKNIAQYMYMAATNGYPQVTAKDVLPLVEKQYREEMAELASVSSEDMLEQLVGKANLDRYRKAAISKSKTKAATKPEIKDTGTPKTKEEAPKKSEKIPFNKVFNFRS